MNNKKYKILLLSSFITIITLIIVKGSIGKFITPKMSIYVYLSLPLLFIFLYRESIKNNLKSKNKKSVLNMLCVLPIIFGIVGSSGGLSNEYVNFKANVNLAAKKHNASQVTKDISNNMNNNAKEEMEPSIIVNDNSYMNTLFLMYNNLSDYVGKKVRLQGCAFRTSEMKYDQFAIGKYYMYCCAVDLSLSGYLCKYDDYTDVENNKWYEIEGIIEKHSYIDPYTNILSDEPILRITRIKEIGEPTNTTVYN